MQVLNELVEMQDLFTRDDVSRMIMFGLTFDEATVEQIVERFDSSNRECDFILQSFLSVFDSLTRFTDSSVQLSFECLIRMFESGVNM